MCALEIGVVIVAKWDLIVTAFVQLVSLVLIQTLATRTMDNSVIVFLGVAQIVPRLMNVAIIVFVALAITVAPTSVIILE